MKLGKSGVNNRFEYIQKLGVYRTPFVQGTRNRELITVGKEI